MAGRARAAARADRQPGSPCALRIRDAGVERRCECARPLVSCARGGRQSAARAVGARGPSLSPSPVARRRVSAVRAVQPGAAGGNSADGGYLLSETLARRDVQRAPIARNSGYGARLPRWAAAWLSFAATPNHAAGGRRVVSGSRRRENTLIKSK